LAEFTPEQEMFRDMVRRIANEKIAPLAEEIEVKGHYPDELIVLLREQGLFGIPIPEEYGGAGHGILTSCLVTEELAKVCSNSAMIIANQELGGYSYTACW